MKNNNNSILLSILKGLYKQLGQISLVITQIRIRSYQRMFKPDIPINITTILDKQIDILAERAITEHVEDIEIYEAVRVKISQENTEYKQTLSENVPEIKYKNVIGIESEFAKYLKQRKMTSVSQPHLGENLKASTWEHIHSAIRHARKGELYKAKLHTSFAGTALEEAGHFMNNDDYAELMFEIEHYINESHKT